MQTKLPPNFLGAALRAGQLAPTFNNRQDWHARFEGDVLVVDLVARPTVSVIDPAGHTDEMAVGAYVASVDVFARAHGMTTKVERDEKNRARTTIEFTRGDDPTDDDAANCAALATRSTNRRPPRRRALTPHQVDALSGVIGDTGVRVHVTDDEGPKTEIAKSTGRAAWLTMQVESFHKEAMSALRFTRDEARTTRDGIDVGTLEMPPEGIGRGRSDANVRNGARDARGPNRVGPCSHDG